MEARAPVGFRGLTAVISQYFHPWHSLVLARTRHPAPPIVSIGIKVRSHIRIP